MLGPIILVWFFAIGILGLRAIIETPDILWALNPAYGIVLFVIDPHIAFLALGSIFCPSPAPRRYLPISAISARSRSRRRWLYVVLPGLVLNYFGQGAAILSESRQSGEPVLHPRFGRLALSDGHPRDLGVDHREPGRDHRCVLDHQAGGAARAAAADGSPPHLGDRFGQIYVPRANALLLAGVIAIVLIFKSPDALSNAYGLAVTGVFVISTFLVTIVALQQWRWKPWVVVMVFGLFAVVDLAFFSSALHQIRPWRVASDLHRGRRVDVHEHLAHRAARAGRESLRLGARDRHLPGLDGKAATPRRGNGDFHHAAAGRGSRRASAQHEAQQGAARAGDLPARRRARRSVRPL